MKNKLGLRAPRGWGWITNPKRAAYNRVYNRTTRGCLVLVVAMVMGIGSLGLVLAIVVPVVRLSVQTELRTD